MTVRLREDAAVLDVTPMLRPERAAFLELLGSLSPDQWEQPTECPAYDVKGVAAHVLGDDLSLLSRQRDHATNSLVLMAEKMPGAEFSAILDGFNDRWVSTIRFMSTALLVDLLEFSGDRTAVFYESVDVQSPCEPVFFFGSTGELSPYWQAIAREYVERWVHHSQILRALGSRSLAEDRFVRTGVEVVAAAAGADASFDGGHWSIGPLRLGDRQQTADLLTRCHTGDEIRALVTGPDTAVDLAVASFSR